MVDLTETISHLPAGSQVLLSSASFEKLFGRLHEIRLTAASGPSQGSPQFKQHSKEYTQGLFVSSNRLDSIMAAALVSIPACSIVQRPCIAHWQGKREAVQRVSVCALDHSNNNRGKREAVQRVNVCAPQ